MQDYEKLGLFYLGKKFDPENKKCLDDLILYDSSDLVTHAVCLGMTGSGKTGLCIDLLEEAAIDNIPVIAIDLKGDLANMLLTFPEMDAKSFLPWVDLDKARRESLSPEELAEREALSWKAGLAEWGQSPNRVRLLHETVKPRIYTPGRSHGTKLSVLASFACPESAVLEDRDLMREEITGTVTSFLALMQIDAEPLKSREHILISAIVDHEWQQGNDLTLNNLIEKIQAPPLKQIGALPLESFFPAKDRFNLAASLNNMLAAPGFEMWTEGEPLNIDQLFYDDKGKAKLSIISLSQLSDTERMFFVSLLLSRLLGWMRKQNGSSSLRAIFYMDEIFGYFPPVSNPPSKTPLITLLKQARAFGLGMVLATQNPVDLDYKALGNTGTWFIGRLQTERDKMRVLDGLEGAAADSGSAFDRNQLDKLISSLQKRVFLMNNIHEDQPVLFQSRFSLSYLCGPLSRQQLKSLNQSGKNSGEINGSQSIQKPVQEKNKSEKDSSGKRPLLPPEIPQKFAPFPQTNSANQRFVYKPMIFSSAQLHFTDKKAVSGYKRNVSFLCELESDSGSCHWDKTQPSALSAQMLLNEPAASTGFADLPPNLTKTFGSLSKDFLKWLHSNQKLEIFKHAVTNQYSKADETERDFRIRQTHELREIRDRKLAELKDKYTQKLTTLEEKLARAQKTLSNEKAQAQDLDLQSALSIGNTILGAFVGRKMITSSNLNRAAQAARNVQRSSRQKDNIADAEDSITKLTDKITDLETEFEGEVIDLKNNFESEANKLEPIGIEPDKTSTILTNFVLCWVPVPVTAT